MAGALRDLTLRLSLADAGVLQSLERANAEMDELRNAAGVTQDEIAALGDVAAQVGGEIGSMMDRAAESTSGLAESFRQAQPVLGAMGLALTALMGKAASMAMDVEFAESRVRALVTRGYEELTAAIEQEASRWGRAITRSGLIEALIPVVATIPEYADKVAEALKRVDEAIIMMGGDARATTAVWTYIAQAIGSGSAEILMKANRLLPFPIIRGEEARRIARMMSKDYDDLTNTLILLEAITKSQAVEQQKLNLIMETGRFKTLQFRGAWTDLMEEMGKGQAQVVGGVAGWAARKIDEFIRSGGGEPFGRFLTILGGLLAVIGGPSVLAKLLGMIGIGTGTVAGLLTGVLPWVAALAALALVLEDIIGALFGRKSFLVEWVGKPIYEFFVKTLPEGIAKFGELLDKYVVQPLHDFFGKTLPENIAKFGEILDQYVVQPLKAAFGWLASAVSTIAEKVLGFFGFETPEKRAEREAKEAAEADLQRRAAEAVAALGEPVPLVVKEGGYIDWVETARRHLGEEWEAAVRPVATTVTVDPILEERLKEVTQQMEEADRLRGTLSLTLPGVSPTGPGTVPSFTLSISPGAVQVNVGGNLVSLPEEERERVIQETLRAIEDQLRAVLYEEPVPGVR